MEKDYFEEFINNKKEYNNTKRHNVNKKLDYIIAQTDVIFNILKDINDNQIKAEFININQVKPPDFNNPPMMLLNADNTDIQVDNNITWKVKNELESYALDLNYVGCKIIIDLCNIAPINGITEDTDYDTICNILYPKDPNYIKRNITFIRKKINKVTGNKFGTVKFPNNMDLLKYFIELCY